jgi:hypothetical protein
MREFHQRRYPDRPAFYLRLEGGKSALIPLGALTELARPGGGGSEGVPDL